MIIHLLMKYLQKNRFPQNFFLEIKDKKKGVFESIHPK
ncbi:hypothetical protein CP99DC5_0370 [Chlamydia psittaci 99DC5]|uniref:Uncharacterized protein n=1 Tax=Chlamydia psittaci 99DC5 TaxID=1112251 RepID=A0ABN0MPR0_CHLPS|nr:hypothetical protein CP99DC5_0370 [Chlamydia psittaci 99DC5]